MFLADSSVLPGEALEANIVRAIEQCDLFVLLWSVHAKGSEWVPQEIGVARGCKRPIIPIVLHESANPTGFLRGTKYLPLYRDPAKGLAWLKEHVFEAATAKQQREGLAWLGIGAAFLYLLSQDARRPR